MKKPIVSIMALLLVSLLTVPSIASAYTVTAVPCNKSNNCFIKKDHKVKYHKDKKGNNGPIVKSSDSLYPFDSVQEDATDILDIMIEM